MDGNLLYMLMLIVFFCFGLFNAGAAILTKGPMSQKFLTLAGFSFLIDLLFYIGI